MRTRADGQVVGRFDDVVTGGGAVGGERQCPAAIVARDFFQNEIAAYGIVGVECGVRLADGDGVLFEERSWDRPIAGLRSARQRSHDKTRL